MLCWRRWNTRELPLRPTTSGSSAAARTVHPKRTGLARCNIFGIAGSAIWRVSLFLLATIPAYTQDNYEVQVYGVETVLPKHTMLELHSNFTFEGSKTMVDGVRPDNH